MRPIARMMVLAAGVGAILLTGSLGGCGLIQRPVPTDGSSDTPSLDGDIPANALDAASAWQKKNTLSWIERLFFGKNGNSPGFERAALAAHAECQAQAANPTLPQRAMAELVYTMKDLLANGLAQNQELHDPEYAVGLQINAFRGASISENELEFIQQRLASLLKSDPAVSEHFYIVAYSIEEADDVLRSSAGEAYVDATQRNRQEVVRIPWHLFVEANGTWRQSVTPSADPAKVLPRLTIEANLQFCRVRDRSLVESHHFDISFVYHPDYGWISERVNNELIARRKR